MDLAFLCGLFPNHLESEIVKQSLGRIDFAANNLQWSFVKGLDHHNGKPIKLLNCSYVGSYPGGYKKLNIKTGNFSHAPSASDINIGYCNLVGLNFAGRLLGAFKYLKKWAKDGGEQKKVLLIYAVHSPFLLSAALIKKMNSQIKLCLIVPDLPQYMSDNNGILRRFFKYLDSKIIGFALKKIDSFVVLSDFMTDQINIEKKPWIRIEGIFDNSLITEQQEKSPSVINRIMYSGNLDVSQGINDLLLAFAKIEQSNYSLWFTGHGNGLERIKEAAEKDSRITYFENLTKPELLAKQREVTLLINPLKPTNPKVKFFFPSKTMEYLASGRVTLMYRLPSIPTEYNHHLYFFDEDSIDAMKDKIVEICEKPYSELKDFGDRAKSFILDQKTPIPQCGKLYDMLIKL